MKYHGLWQPMFVSFIGYKDNKVTVGAEFTYKSNLEPVKGHHAWGLSGTGSLAILRKTEIFARFDYSASVNAPDIRRHWHYIMDGSFLITGIQYSIKSCLFKRPLQVLEWLKGKSLIPLEDPACMQCL